MLLFLSNLQGLPISANNRRRTFLKDEFQGDISSGVIFGEDGSVLIFGPHVFEGRGAFFTCAFKGGFAEGFPFKFFLPYDSHVKGFFCDRVCDPDVRSDRAPFAFCVFGQVHFDFGVIVGD